MLLVRRITLLVLLGIACLCAGFASAQDGAKKNTKFPQCILIIRHAEKTGENGDFHLSKKGVERADVLYRLFEKSKDRANPLPTPDFIFAASNHKNSHRPLETVTPFAMKLKLTINQKFDSKDDDKIGNNGLRDAVFSDSKYVGKTILISWRHGVLPELAKSLKATDAPTKWHDDVFDRVWQINYDNRGKATFLDRPQGLLPGDSEK